MKIRKKHIALIGIFILLMSSVLQLVDSFGEHKQHLNCDILHFQLNTFNSSISSEYKFFIKHFYTSIFSDKPQRFKTVYRSKKSSRAPPLFTA